MKKCTAIVSSLLICGTPPTLANDFPQSGMPPNADDTPEEILQTEVITSARSPIDNQPLTATEYAELQIAIEQANQVSPKLSSKARNIVALLKLRQFIKTTLPFIPLK
jgi:hypothetical protein